MLWPQHLLQGSIILLSCSSTIVKPNSALQLGRQYMVSSQRWMGVPCHLQKGNWADEEVGDC